MQYVAMWPMSEDSDGSYVILMSIQLNIYHIFMHFEMLNNSEGE